MVDDELGNPEDDVHHQKADADDDKVEGVSRRNEVGDETCRKARSGNADDRGGPVQDDLTPDAGTSRIFPDPVAAHEVRRDRADEVRNECGNRRVDDPASVQNEKGGFAHPKGNCRGSGIACESFDPGVTLCQRSRLSDCGPQEWLRAAGDGARGSSVLKRRTAEANLDRWVSLGRGGNASCDEGVAIVECGGDVIKTSLPPS